MSIHLSKYHWLLIGLTLTGLLIRTYKLGSNPVSLYWDEAAIGYDAWSLAQSGKDMHGQSLWQAIFPSYGDYKMPMYIWLAAIAVKVTGATEMGVRLPSALAGTLLIPVIYGLGKSLFKSPGIGLAAAGLVAVSPWAVQFSRAGFEANVGVLCLSAAAWSGLQAKDRPVWWLMAGIGAAAAVYSYFSVRFVLPGLLLGIIALNGLARSTRSWLYVAGAGVIFGLLTLPIYRSPYYAASNQLRLSTASLLNTNDQVMTQNVNRQFAGNTPVARLLYHRNMFQLGRLATNLGAFLDPRYLFFTGDPNLRHGTGTTGLFFWPTLVFFGTGWLAVGKRQPLAALFLCLWWVSAVIPAAIPLTVPHALRSLNALPPLALVMGYGVAALARSRYHALRGVLIALVVLTGLSFLSYWHDYRRHYPERSAQAWQSGYKQIARYVAEHGNGYERVMVTPADRLYLYFLFYQHIPPQTAWLSSEYFRINHYNNVTFQAVDEMTYNRLPPATMVVITADQYGAYASPPPIKATITDDRGQPQFVALEK